MITKRTVVHAVLLSLVGIIGNQALAAMNHNGMIMDEKGMIMNHNPDKLPKDCKKVSEDVNITVRAGQKYAKNFTGKMYAFDQQEWNVAPCSRLNITFINDDEVRHQFMMHGLPGYLYPTGMFNIEVYGKGQKTASLIFGTKPKTYLVHCEVPQHMEMGMKAQIKVAGGDGDLSSIPGLTEPVTADAYPIEWGENSIYFLVIAVLIGLAIPRLIFGRS